jgi:predicted kinase
MSLRYDQRMKTLYIMCGVGFSGKSSLAKKIAEHTGAILVSQDSMFFEKEKELDLDQDSDEQWRMILNMCREIIREELSKGDSVVFDDTSLRLKHREKLREIAKDVGAETKVIFLDTPLDIQKQRQEKNKITGERHDVKQEYLDQVIAELERPNESENVVVVKPDYDFNEIASLLK